MREFKVFDRDKITFHPTAERIAQHLCAYCENDVPTFFRVLTSYALAKVASQMRASIKTHNQKPLPINMYAVDLAPSGFGKTKAMNFLEEEVAGLFNERFKDELLPYATEKNLAKLATRRSISNSTDPDDEMDDLIAEFKASGTWLPSFDSATPAALKQFRHKLLMADAGSLNFEIDEIGDNLTGNQEAFSKFLELYDKGKIKESLTKNTKDNQRLTHIEGQTPCNLIMFGSPASLMDGGKKEEEFFTMLEKGYARRCLFGIAKSVNRNLDMTAEEIYQRNVSKQSLEFIEEFAEQLLELADPLHYKRQIALDYEEEILRIEYDLWCKDRAEEMSEFDVVKRIEMEHRWFKAMKLAATYAFIEGNAKITATNLYNAIAVVEDSGASFQGLLTRDRPYVKLAKYLGGTTRPVTQVELVEDLPFFKGNQSQKAEMLTMAVAYGYQNNIIIKKQFIDGIEFLKGESLKETDTDALTVSYSDHVAYNYFNDTITWENLAKLTQMNDIHWVSHHVLEGHRCEDKTKPGFNLLVIDCDGDVPLATAQALLHDYKAIFYTTKRHQTEGVDRFRIVLPMKYTLKMDGTDYREFMEAVYSWLPFDIDEQTSQRSRKWLSHEGNCLVQDGELFDPVSFIPKTTKNEERKQRLLDQASLTNLERWFVNNTGQGNRSNQLIKYALLLVDSGKTLSQVEQATLALNEKLADKLPEDEIHTTIMITARKAFAKAQAA
ncbi:DUF3987 domain-containing protein [Alteromonas sp. RKMC-009]|uniref:DUF3987 domain-containing protein n=1 Tax=Alteromonas sp. RKMC-009 TaxID=2267264 RepID=UPI000E6979C1|nr:DUF3987 domain-containing protein [Alteromonas sp. RKMC-009]AYA64341.1 DUF3987 domain-containing protein [Alteromonas sp. RKMC-009]